MSTSAPRRPGTLPEAHESVFDMKAGEISPVFSDPAAFYIYKVVSVRQVPLSEVKATISQTLQRQIVTDKIQQIQSAVTPVLNDAYLGRNARGSADAAGHQSSPADAAGGPGVPPPANAGMPPAPPSSATRRRNRPPQ